VADAERIFTKGKNVRKIFVQKLYTKFLKNSTNCLAVDTSSQSDGRAKVFSTQGGIHVRLSLLRKEHLNS
jgi:uncharacterized protein YaiL (DUF2058 family)